MKIILHVNLSTLANWLINLFSLLVCGELQKQPSEVLYKKDNSSGLNIWVVAFGALDAMKSEA